MTSLNVDHEVVRSTAGEASRLRQHLVAEHGMDALDVAAVESGELGRDHHQAHVDEAVKTTRRSTEDLPSIGRWTSGASYRARPVAPEPPEHIKTPEGYLSWKEGWEAGYDFGRSQ